MESTAPAAETLETAAAIEPSEAGSAAPATLPTPAPEAPKAGAPRPARTPAAATPAPPTAKPGE
ncbi:MAG TPA: hypothetical protein PL091_15615 [Actinomycetota bacterium]|nr:hypothetical protein [Actinomycetota bacterium]